MLLKQAEEDTTTPQGPTTAEAHVTIRILDVNDQVPTFNQAQYSATLLENTQATIPVTFDPVGTQMIISDMDEVRPRKKNKRKKAMWPLSEVKLLFTYTLQSKGGCLETITLLLAPQGNNGTFSLVLEQGGQQFDVFEVVPDKVLNEANLLVRVKNVSALDYEKVNSFTFNVSETEALCKLVCYWQFLYERFQNKAAVVVDDSTRVSDSRAA